MKKIDELPLAIAKLMLENNFVILLTNMISDIDVNHPQSSNIIYNLIKPLDLLILAAIEINKNSETTTIVQVQEEEENSNVPIINIESQTPRDEEHEITDMYRTSALGIFSGENENEDDDDDDDEDVSPITSTSPKMSSQSFSLNNLKGESYRIKLLFKSGQTQFYNELCKTINEEHWKVITKENKIPKTQRVGVAGIIRNIQENQKNTNEIMNQAFKDLNNLMKKASEMVAIAESISQKINQDNSMEGSKEQNQLKEILQELGISNPVTR